MKILTIAFVFNEDKYIQAMIDYYKNQGTDLYIIDNMSTDKTNEILKNNNVPCHRFDTGGAFDLRLLQNETMRIIANINPDWVVYTGADLFYSFKGTIREEILMAEVGGFNQLSVPCWGALNTGEKENSNLCNNYFMAKKWKDIIMISKYDRGFFMGGDNILIINPIIKQAEGVMINYGACKPSIEQEEKLLRRAKAWELGLNKNTGRHFRKGKEKNWIYSKEGLSDIRKIEETKYFKKLWL